MATAAITLRQFERIDSAMAALLRMGPFDGLAHDQARDYIRTENRLLDYCIDAVGYEAANDWPSALECAAAIVTDALLCKIEVLDEEAA